MLEGSPPRLKLAAILAALAVALAPLDAQTTRASTRPASDLDPLPLSAASHDAWRSYVLPEESELRWAEIPWLSTFEAGMRAADAPQ